MQSSSNRYIRLTQNLRINNIVSDVIGGINKKPCRIDNPGTGNIKLAMTKTGLLQRNTSHLKELYVVW